MPAVVETMFNAREIPWHRLGVVTDDALTAADAIVTAGLDWTVEKRPLAFRNANGNFTRIKDFYALVRDMDDKVLGTGVSERYEVFQNTQCFEFLNTLVDDGLKFNSAGSLRGGKTVWVSAELPADVLIAGEDQVNCNIIATTTHDGGGSTRIAVTPIRPVCMNTLNLALNVARQAWSVWHVGDVEGKVQEAREALQLTFDYMDAFKDMGDWLASETISDAEVDRIFDELIEDTPRKDTKIAGLQFAYHESPTLEGYRGTKWGVLNAVGEYYDWLRPIRTEDSRTIGTLQGVGYKQRNRTLEMLRA